SLSSPHHPSPTVIYPLSLHDALPISGRAARAWSRHRGAPGPRMRRLRPAGRLSQDHALDERRAPRSPAHLREGGLSPGARRTSPQLRARSRGTDVGADAVTDRDGFQDHFSTTAAAYAAHRPAYPPVLIDSLAALAPRPDGAWDAA